MQGKHCHESDCCCTLLQYTIDCSSNSWRYTHKSERDAICVLLFSSSDLNKDGCLTYKDFLWAKDKICYMSGWKIDSPKYKITEALFHQIWESLEIIADVDKDGKITKTEWVIKAFYLTFAYWHPMCYFLLHQQTKP